MSEPLGAGPGGNPRWMATPRYSLGAGSWLGTPQLNAAAPATVTLVANRYELVPVVVPLTTVIDRLETSVSTLGASAVHLFILDANQVTGAPVNVALTSVLNLSTAVVGAIGANLASPVTLNGGTLVWFGVHMSLAVGALRAIPLAAVPPLRPLVGTETAAVTVKRGTAAFSAVGLTAMPVLTDTSATPIAIRARATSTE